MLAEVLAGQGRAAGDPWGGDGARAVWRALAVMRDHLHDDLDLETISARVGLSARSLQLACRRMLDLSPIQLLRLERLARARSELLRGSDPVTSVALRCGFGHLGRFSTDYRRLYGERPRDTRSLAARAQEVGRGGAGPLGDRAGAGAQASGEPA